ncbi:hypothetical protein CDD80_358 [Ophiocordyceps camponoti-rufipedis]|uniref:SGS domain-containing protein n=1 Tax=Ophiocordyceps camponoti-rufipedis TaxID=2004952 RepID=A0A2C5YRF7_9HYPO|nr:hypothetical protein CDD80_358 [Ophiocordyceps camponoti-rufipedis]
MSHLTTAQQGLEAIKTKQWDLAITKLTTALETTPSPIWLLARSKAFIGKSLATEALTDAERAWHVAYDRGSRPLMLEAQYRRAVACYHLGRLADADCCCVYAMRLAKGFAAVEEKDPGLEFRPEKTTTQQPKTKTEDKDATPPQAELSPRTQEFQTPTTMNVSIFTKGTDKSSLNVVFHPDSVHLENLVYPDGKARDFHLRLWGKIDAQASSFAVTANKVELRLVKVGGKWPFLLRVEGDAVAGGEDTKPQSKPETLPAKPPSYPSSSRTGPKDWDKVVPEEEEDEKEEGVNDFFKKLYKGATPEQQRAMMKSFTESNGTSLSTDWNDVKGRTVETVPPEGMEAKRY